MPIEEVTVEPEDQMTLADKLSAREEFWYRELCSVYPYGLNDNVYKVGNKHLSFVGTWYNWVLFVQ